MYDLLRANIDLKKSKNQEWSFGINIILNQNYWKSVALTSRWILKHPNDSVSDSPVLACRLRHLDQSGRLHEPMASTFYERLRSGASPQWGSNLLSFFYFLKNLFISVQRRLCMTSASHIHAHACRIGIPTSIMQDASQKEKSRALRI